MNDRALYHRSMSLPPWAALAATAAGLGLFAYLVLRARRFLELRRLRRRFARGARGQREARDLLQREGYEVLAEEHEVEAVIDVDGEPLPYSVRVDYMVRRGSAIYGVEVKTGDKATDPLYRPTRRQLLEYSHLLDVDGLYLLDMEARRMMRIRFRGAGQRRRGRWALALVILGFVLGAAAALFVQGGGPWP